MAGLFPGVCNAQNVDTDGIPQAGAVLTVYNGGTTQLASVFQDIGLAIAGKNPMTADATGRMPFFYVADGTYRVRLVDQFGTLIYDYPQVASIGASSSGGGGSGVDPATIFQTGDPLWVPVANVARSGWVRANGRTIGSSTSGASERANADCQPLFLFLWGTYSDTNCPVVGGRGASAAADWSANKQITLYSLRGRGPVGLDGMGNGRANILPDASVTSGGGDTGDTALATGGEANHTLVNSELPATSVTPTFSGSAVNLGTITINENDVMRKANFQTATASGGVTFTALQNGVGTTIDVTIPSFTPAGAISAVTFGGNAAHNNMIPFALGTWYLKL